MKRKQIQLIYSIELPSEDDSGKASRHINKLAQLLQQEGVKYGQQKTIEVKIVESVFKQSEL